MMSHISGKEGVMNRGSDDHFDGDNEVTEQEVNAFMIQFVTTIARIKERVILPQPANDNCFSKGGDDDVA